MRRAREWFGGGADLVFEARSATVVWQGDHRHARSLGSRLRLYKRTYENPRPELKVRSLTFESTLSSCSPTLLAVTIE